MKNIKFISLITEIKRGQCFPWAYRKVAKGGPFLTLVHGKIYHKGLQRYIDHAWVETKKRVFDWQTNESIKKDVALSHIKLNGIDDEKKQREIMWKGWDKNDYYKIFKPKVNKKYDKLEAMKSIMKYKNMGPWK